MPFFIDACRVGSVAPAALPALRAWQQHLRIDAQGIALRAPPADRDAALAEINSALRAQGWVRGWRDERFAIANPDGGLPLAQTERAASRFWGTQTLGAHASGYVADAQGRPARLWIAQRSFTKPTDPGRFDNLVGGGVAAGQSPWQALIREGWEEAGLPPAQMQAARPGRVIRLQREVAEGWQCEDLHAYDLALPPGVTPSNRDGEVQGFSCLAIDDALALAAGASMTVDASLVTLDFALRHGLLPAAEAALLAQALTPALRGMAQIP